MTSKTIALTGAEIRVDYGRGTNVWLRNDGTDVIYASTMPGITAGADGVVSIPAGQAAAVYGAAGTVYLLGTGSVQLVGSDYTACPFKTSAQAGGSGADEVARAAIAAHSGNADIHVTADEKVSWNGKAELSDIPEKLPADGGNADTVDGKHAVDFALSDNPSIEGEIKLLRANNATTTSTIFAWEETARIRNIDPNAEKQTYTDLIVTPEGIYSEGFSNGVMKARRNIADGGNAASVDSANHKVRLFEDADGGNLRLESPDGSVTMETDMYDNTSLRMCFIRNGKLAIPFNYNSIYENLEIPKLNGARISSVGAKKGYVSSSIADVIRYGERVVHKLSFDTSYIGYTVASDGWFSPIFVSKTVEGTRYTMNGNECVYSDGGERCASFTHNGETYYACWNNPASLMNPALATSAFYVALSGGDYVSACKKLIDECEGVYAGASKRLQCSCIIGTNESLEYHTILDWAAANIGQEAYAFVISGTGFPSDAPVQAEGCVTIKSDVYGRQVVVFQQYGGSAVWKRNVFAKAWLTDWANMADGGNAASVGAYTEAKIAALEARIAALEGGNV